MTLPTFKKFKADYDELSVGKGFGATREEVEHKLSSFLENSAEILKEKGYESVENSLMVTGKALGVEPNKMYHILETPLLKHFKEARRAKNINLLITLTGMLVKLMYMHSAKREFDKMFSDD